MFFVWRFPLFSHFISSSLLCSSCRFYYVRTSGRSYQSPSSPHCPWTSQRSPIKPMILKNSNSMSPCSCLWGLDLLRSITTRLCLRIHGRTISSFSIPFLSFKLHVHCSFRTFQNDRRFFEHDLVYVFPNGGNSCPSWKRRLFLTLFVFLLLSLHLLGWTFAIWSYSLVVE